MISLLFASNRIQGGEIDYTYSCSVDRAVKFPECGKKSTGHIVENNNNKFLCIILF